MLRSTIKGYLKGDSGHNNNKDLTSTTTMTILLLCSLRRPFSTVLLLLLLLEEVNSFITTTPPHIVLGGKVVVARVVGQHDICPHPYVGKRSAVHHPVLVTTQPRIESRLKATPEGGTKDVSIATPFDRPVLALVDLAALIIFAGLGKASHSPDGSIDLVAVLTVAFPFVVAWFATSPFTGVYKADERKNNLIQDSFITAAKGWIVAVPLGCVLRGFILGYVPPLPFVAVTLIATLIILGVARVIFAAAEDFFVELVN